MATCKYKCSKCGEIKEPDAHQCAFGETHAHDWQPLTNNMKENVTLSLLLIDLGDSCVVKVEINESTSYTFLEVGADKSKLDCDECSLIPFGFADVRDRVDKLIESNKPVPRIERNGGGQDNFPYRILAGSDKGLSGSFLTQQDYDALSTIAGKPLPIYHPQRSEWTHLMDPTCAEPPATFDLWRFQIFE